MSIYIIYEANRRVCAAFAAVLWGQALLDITRHYTMLYYAILYHTMLYYTMLYYTIPCQTILYHAILYYTMLKYTILFYTRLD